jgi:peptidoglycan L-alanyl-D-glutamate endopeptidase CwlK
MGIGLLIFPGMRAAVFKKLCQLGFAGKGYLGKNLASLKGGGSHVVVGIAGKLEFIKTAIQKHPFVFSGCLLAVTLPPVASFLYSKNITLEGFEDNGQLVNVQIAELLKGEQLAPPPPLPPEVFTTHEVLILRPTLVSASRDWQLLHPEYAQRLLIVFKLMKEKYGYDMALLEGYRSPERQDALAQMGNHVTGAKAYQSYHQHGLAADVAFLRDGKLVISEREPWAMAGYQNYGELAESVGLTWGGRWKMMDFGHTELRLPGVMKK